MNFQESKINFNLPNAEYLFSEASILSGIIYTISPITNFYLGFFLIIKFKYKFMVTVIDIFV